MNIFTTEKVFFGFSGKYDDVNRTYFSNIVKYLKSNVQNGTNIFVTEKQHLILTIYGHVAGNLNFFYNL